MRIKKWPGCWAWEQSSYVGTFFSSDILLVILSMDDLSMDDDLAYALALTSRGIFKILKKDIEAVT